LDTLAKYVYHCPLLAGIAPEHARKVTLISEVRGGSTMAFEIPEEVETAEPKAPLAVTTPVALNPWS
jgi:hypothetical protein